MEPDRAAALWQRAEDLRRRGRLELPELLALAQESGPVSWRDAAVLAQGVRDSEVGRPIFLLDFIAELVRSLVPATILDPWVSTPLMLAAASEAAPDARALGLVRSVQDHEIGALIAPADWMLGDPLEALAGLADDRFDLILVAPPAGMEARKRVSEGGSEAAIREMADLVLWRASDSLSESGRILFQTRDNLLTAEYRRRLLDQLGERGIFAQAAISVEGGLAPMSSIATSIVLFGRDRYDDLYVGRLDKATQVPVLVENLIARRAGQAIQLGALTPARLFRGWRSFVLQSELADSTQPGETQILGDIATVRRVELRADRLYEPPPNCAFVPTLGFGSVTTSPPELDGIRRYALIEVALDPSVARAEYISAYLSSPTGMRMREALAIGDAIPHLKAPDLATLRLPVPPLSTQEGAMRAFVHLASMESATRRLRNELWMNPESASHILDRLEAEAKADPMRRWMDALPYPIASVLRRYTAERSAASRVERLLHFFEVTAEFGCAVLISVLQAAPDLLAEAQPDIAKAAPPGRELFERTDFGLWVNLGRTLAKSMRRLGDDSGRRDRLREAAEPAGRLVERYSEKEIWSVLDSARTIRNQRAHSGVLDRDQHSRWLTSLESLLGEAEQALSAGFDDIDLARAESGSFRKGLHVYERAQRLRGPNDIFDEFEIRTRTPLESEHLAFVSRTVPITPVLHLAPLVRLGPSPTSSHNACYFFNSQESNGEWSFVSYHFEEEPRIRLKDQDVMALANELSGRPPSGSID